MPLTLDASPPHAPAKPSTSEHHGRTRRDDYAWLRAENWREVMREPSALDAEIRAYLEAENAYTEAAFRPLAELRETLIAEIRGRMKEDDASVPVEDGQYAYYTKYRLGAEQPCFHRIGKLGDELILDGEAQAAAHSYFRLGGVTHSPDHGYLAWSADTAGSEYFTVRVRDLDTGKDLDDVVPDVAGGVVWAETSNAFLYIRLDEEHRPNRVFLHRVGTPASDDRLIYEEPDTGFYLGLGKTQSRDFLTITASDHETSEVRLLPADNPLEAPYLVSPRTQGHEYSLEHDAPRHRFFILTNRGSSEDFEICEAPQSAPQAENWTPLVPHRAGHLILAQHALQDFLIRLERVDGLGQLIVHHIESGAEQPIAFAEEAYSLGLLPTEDYARPVFRFSYSSMTTPSEVWDQDCATWARVLRKRQEVPSGHDPANYVTRRLFATAQDGERVPISLLYAKDTPLDGTAPCLLYGYGSYGISIPASFSVSALSLVDRGFVYAIAHVRGGKDKGYRWYKDGKREHKTNTFTDFIAAAEFLIAENITAKGRIVAQGGSAGGMLMGAIANMAPELFLGIIAEVPFVDVLATMLDASLPLTPPEWPEWGNPVDSAEDYARIASYSPYDNVSAQAYPAMLVLGGLTDPRVTYWEPAKWVAKLRATKTDDNPLLLRINMDAGHGGASGRFQRLEEIALVQAFALALAGKA